MPPPGPRHGIAVRNAPVTSDFPIRSAAGSGHLVTWSRGPRHSTNQGTDQPVLRNHVASVHPLVEVERADARRQTGGPHA
jgi:hypothetical protein